MANQIVTLTRPLNTGKGQVTQFEFREPRFDDVMLLGEPTAPLSIGGDRFVPSPLPGVIRVYAERLLVNGDVTIMGAASLRDTLAIQKVILGFFEDAALPVKSDDSAANSPSTSETTSQASGV